MPYRERSLRVKNRMRVIRSSGSVRGGDGNIPAYSAEGELDLATFGKLWIGVVAIDLQDALEAGKMAEQPLGLAVGCIDIGDAGRIEAAPGPVVGGIGPELAGPGAPSTGIEHRHRRLVGEQLGPRSKHREKALMQRAQMEGGMPNPIRQGRSIESDALAGIDLGLPVERQMIGIFGHQNLGDVASVGSPPSINRAGASACRTPSSHARQAYLGRRVTTTRNCAGTMSSRSLLSSPIWCRSPWQQGQVLASRSTTTSIRGRCAGSAPRLLRRLRARSARPSGAVSSWLASVQAATCWTSSRPSSICSSASDSAFRPKR